MSDDPEMDAIVVLGQALGDLNRSQATRVLQWAQSRFVDLPSLPELDHSESLSKFMQAVTETAVKIGMASPMHLMNAIGRVAENLPAEEDPA